VLFRSFLFRRLMGLLRRTVSRGLAPRVLQERGMPHALGTYPTVR
jgi:hypothetical protein